VQDGRQLSQPQQQQQQQQQQHDSRQATPEEEETSRRSPGREGSAYGILSFFAKELHRFNENHGLRVQDHQYRQPRHQAHQDKDTRKRRRVDSEEVRWMADIAEAPDFQPLGVVDEIIDAYFAHVHPWIPMIHEATFRKRLTDPLEKPKLEAIVQAMVIAATRYLKDKTNPFITTWDQACIVGLRNRIISTSLRSLCVESLQACIIIAFNDVSRVGPLDNLSFF
jgi:hypothetical protein